MSGTSLSPSTGSRRREISTHATSPILFTRRSSKHISSGLGPWKKVQKFSKILKPKMCYSHHRWPILTWFWNLAIQFNSSYHNLFSSPNYKSLSYLVPYSVLCCHVPHQKKYTWNSWYESSAKLLWEPQISRQLVLITMS